MRIERRTNLPILRSGRCRLICAKKFTSGAKIIRSHVGFSLTTSPHIRYIAYMKNYTEGEVLNALRIAVSRSNQVSVAKSLGFSPQFLSDVLGERRPVTRELASSMGYRELERRFVKKELASAKGFSQ